jgi:hypothetical protein
LPAKKFSFGGLTAINVPFASLPLAFGLVAWNQLHHNPLKHNSWNELLGGWQELVLNVGLIGLAMSIAFEQPEVVE